MSLASRAGDLFYTFRFIKLLTTPWEETDAFKLGLIDAKGKRIKSKQIKTSEEKDAYTTFHRLVYNVKRLMNQVPGGKSKIASYAAALFLLKEEFGMTDDGIRKLAEKIGVDSSDLLEATNNWYLLDDKQLSPGVYRIQEFKLLNNFTEVMARDTIRVNESCYPIGDVFGIDVYKAQHINTKQPIYFTLGEIQK